MEKNKPTFSKIYSFYVLSLLIIIYALNQIDRSLVSVLAVSIKKELKINDQNFGWLTGFSFTLLYVTFGIFFGILSDRYNRKWILGISIFLWSICTVLSGLSKNFWQILLSRMFLALGEASCTPVSLSLLSDYFDPKYRSIIVSIYNFGIYFGYGFSFLFGFFSYWRHAFYVLGIPGLVCCLLCLITIQEPNRTSKEISTSAWESLKYIFTKPSFYTISIAGGFQLAAGLSFGSWISVFYSRIHNQTGSDLAIWFSWIIPVFGCLSMILGGSLGDFLNSYTKYGRLILASLVTFLVILPSIPVFLVPSVIASYLILIPKFIIGENWNSLTISSLLQISPKKMNSTFIASYFFINNVIAGFGPVIVGALTDHFGPKSIQYTLLSFIIISLIISEIFYLLTFIFIARDIKKKEEHESI